MKIFPRTREIGSEAVPAEVNVVQESSKSSKVAKKPPRRTTDPVVDNHRDSISSFIDLL